MLFLVVEDDELEVVAGIDLNPYKLKLVKEKYGVTVSKTSYYATTKRYSTNEIAAAQLKAASVPPALDYLVKISDTLKSIEKTLKKIVNTPANR